MCSGMEEGIYRKKSRVHLGRQKQAFDAENQAMPEAMKIADEIVEEEGVKRVTLCKDSWGTLKRIQSDEPGPGLILTLRMMNSESALAGKNIQVEYQWVPAHNRIEGDEEADQQSTRRRISIAEVIPQCKMCHSFYNIFRCPISVEA